MRDNLMSNDGDARVEANLKVIREYLRSEFKGFNLTKDKQDGALCHWFTMTNFQWYTQYTLQVSGPQLSDSSNTPERIKRQLDTDNVAGKMRGRKKGGHFPWGFSMHAH
jgi:hypothetical protein